MKRKLHLMKQITPIIILFFAQFLTNSAQSKPPTQLMKGSERFVSTEKTGKIACYVYKNYTIKTTDGEQSGEDIAVYKRAAATAPTDFCKGEMPSDVSVANTNARYFIGLSGEYLFVDSGTSVSPRKLEIFDLKTGKPIYSTEYHGAVKLQNSRFVFFDKTSTEASATGNCPEATKWKRRNLSVGWVRRTKIELLTLDESFTSEPRCVALQ